MSDPSQQRADQPGGDFVDSQLQAEIESALGDMSLEDMSAMLDAPQRIVGKQEREWKTGTIVAVHNDDVFVEFGPKSQGVCPLAQFDEPPPVGQAMEFMVERFDENDGVLILNRKGAVSKAQWESLDIGQVVEARCTGTNKGGLEMEVAKHKAFMPAGHVDIRHIDDLAVYVGEKMPCEIIELDRARQRIVLSRRSHLETERAHLREKLLESLEEGQQLPAVITSLQAYGAFADLGGMDGLIHISDLSYERIKSPAEVVKEGQQVEVKILKIDRSTDPPKIGLGLKQLQTDPYQSRVNELAEGGTVTGKVTRVTNFGAFVEVAPGVEGLIHISQLSHERVNKVSQVVRPDEVVTAKVLEIDPGKRRISLSLKALKDQEDSSQFDRGEDPMMRKLKAKFGGEDSGLRGGIG